MIAMNITDISSLQCFKKQVNAAISLLKSSQLQSKNKEIAMLLMQIMNGSFHNKLTKKFI